MYTVVALHLHNNKHLIQVKIKATTVQNGGRVNASKNIELNPQNNMAKVHFSV